MGADVGLSEEEIERVVLDDDAFSHRITGDARLYLSAGYALVMQAAHPTIGACAREHSELREDPWGLLLQTVDYLYMVTLSGRDAAEVGRRMREVQDRTCGADPAGGYQGLDPEALAWVHATLIEATVSGYLRFVGPLSRSEVQRFYSEWMPLGRLLGIGEADLPADWDGFCDYFDRMVADRLERNETVDEVIATLDAREPPPIPVVAELWPLLRLAPARALRVATLGLLPEPLRSRFDLSWGRREELELRGMSRGSRLITPLLPKALVEVGPAHLSWRAEEIRNGPLGGGTGAASPVT